MEPASESVQPSNDLASSLSILAGHLESFMHAWEHEPPARIESFLPADGDLRKTVLVELIKYDLEYRWREGADPLYLEDYSSLFDELQDPTMPLDLIYEEYHVRTSAGLEVDADEYVQRFPDQAVAIRRLLDNGHPSHSLSIMNRHHIEVLESLAPGQSFDDFDLILKLGEGSFARVFLAQQRSMQRLVALKISADRGQEAQTLSRFDHDYIVRVYDQRTLPDDGVRLLYMEYVSGGTLQDVVKAVVNSKPMERHGRLLFATVDEQLQKRGESRHGRSPWRQQLENSDWVDTVCWLGACLAEGLVHSHQRNVLHRDIKPANVLLTGEGIPKLADFNISYCSKMDGVSPASFFGGSLGYMPPEQLEACSPAHQREANDIDHRVDIYSLGIVLYELLVGKRPYHDTAANSDWNQRLNRMIEVRRQRAYSYPDEALIPEIVRSTIDECLEPKPEDRWQSASQLHRRLELCSVPKNRKYLFPPSSDYRRRLFPHSRLIMLLGMLLPSVFAAFFNFFYNEAKIIQPMSASMGENAASINQHFMFVQTLINLVSFPLGIYCNDYFIRKSLKATRSAHLGTAPFEWVPILNVGFRCALLALVMWFLAGLAYPISMSIQAVNVAVELYAHFFFSLLLCGLFAVALTYFNVTVYSLLVLVPQAIRQGASERGLGPLVHQLSKRNWLFLLTSAIVPMLASVALAIFSDQTPWILGIISLGGMLAFIICLWSMNRIQSASRRLESAFQNTPAAGFEGRA